MLALEAEQNRGTRVTTLALARRRPGIGEIEMNPGSWLYGASRTTANRSWSIPRRSRAIGFKLAKFGSPSGPLCESASAAALRFLVRLLDKEWLGEDYLLKVGLLELRSRRAAATALWIERASVLALVS